MFSQSKKPTEVYELLWLDTRMKRLSVGRWLSCVIKNHDFLDPIAIDNGFVEPFHRVKVNREEIGPHFFPKADFAADFSQRRLKEQTSRFLDLVNEKSQHH